MQNWPLSENRRKYSEGVGEESVENVIPREINRRMEKIA
jgi:hypothetical protein